MAIDPYYQTYEVTPKRKQTDSRLYSPYIPPATFLPNYSTNEGIAAVTSSGETIVYDKTGKGKVVGSGEISTPTINTTTPTPLTINKDKVVEDYAGRPNLMMQQYMQQDFEREKDIQFNQWRAAFNEQERIAAKSGEADFVGIKKGEPYFISHGPAAGYNLAGYYNEKNANESIRASELDAISKGATFEEYKETKTPFIIPPNRNLTPSYVSFSNPSNVFINKGNSNFISDSEDEKVKAQKFKDWALTPESTYWSEGVGGFLSPFGGRPAGETLGGFMDIIGQGGKSVVTGDAPLFVKTGTQALYGTGSFVAKGFDIFAGKSKEANQYIQTGNILPYAGSIVGFAQEAYVAGKSLKYGKEITKGVTNKGFDVAENLREKIDPSYIRSVETIKQIQLGNNINPIREITIEKPIPITSMKTGIGDVNILEATFKIQEQTPISAKVESLGYSEGKGLILQFDRGIEKGKLIEELGRPNSSIVEDIKKYTNVDAGVLLENLNKEQSPVIKGLGILYDIKGTGIILEKGVLSGNKRVTGYYPIESKGATYAVPDKPEFGIYEPWGSALKTTLPRLMEFGKAKVEYGFSITPKGNIIDITTQGKKGEVQTIFPKWNLGFHTHPTLSADFAQASIYTKIYGLEGLKRTVKFKSLLYGDKITPSPADIRSVTFDNLRTGGIVTSKGVTVYENPLGANLKKLFPDLYTFSEYRQLGGRINYIPFEKFNQLGTEYSLTKGVSAQGETKSIITSKSKLFLETPEAEIYTGITRFYTYGKKPIFGQIRDIIRQQSGTPKKMVGFPNMDENLGSGQRTQTQTFKSLITGQPSAIAESLVKMEGSKYKPNIANLIPFGKSNIQSNLKEVSNIRISNNRNIALGSTLVFNNQKGINLPSTVLINPNIMRTSSNSFISNIIKNKDTNILRNRNIDLDTSVLRNESLIRNKTISSQLLRTATLTSTSMVQSQRFNPFQRVTKPFKPIIGIPTGSPIRLGISKSTKVFDVFTRSKGKEIKIGSSLTRGEALSFGSQYVTKTLRASFKLKPVGFAEKEDTGVSSVSNMFYAKASKGGEERYVERRKFRLDQPLERSEIKASKKAINRILGF